MRRRRNADAPSATDAAEIAADAANSAAETAANPSEPSVVDTDAERDATVEANPASAASAPAGDSADTTVSETPKPRRRAPARRKTPVTDTPPEAVLPFDAQTAEPVAAVTVEPAVIAPSVEASPIVVEETAPARAPRRRRTAVAAVPVVPVTETVAEPAPTAEVVEAPVEAVAEPDVTETVASSAETETPLPARPGRRRGMTRRSAAPAATAEPAASTDAEGGPATEATGDASPVAEPAVDEGRGRRSRGGRRRRTDVVAAAAEAETAEVSNAPAEETAEVGEERRRQRGPRLQRTPRGAGQTGLASLAPIEPLPPQYQALPDDVLARLPETRVLVRKNVPELVVNGEPRLPIWFFVNTEEALLGEDPDAREVAQREIRLAYESGVRFFSVLAHLPWKMRSGERRFGPLDDALQFVAENAPDALILPRLMFTPPGSWERAHADQMTLYPNGETGDVSFGSRLFWEGEADEALRAAVEHVAQGEFAGRVFGFFLEHGEWFHEKGRGYDVSDANTQSFRTWLRTRYRNSQVALRAAWYDGSVTFENAAVPPAMPTINGGGLGNGAPIFYSTREQRYVDFHEYASDVIAGVILKLGKAVKEASGGRSAVVVSYGYTLELARAYSGHLALGQILASPNVDILTGPVSYSGRTPGGSAPLPCPIDSIALSGKLWVSEDDTKTFLAHGDTPDGYNPKVSSFEGTWAAYSRNFGTALTSGAGVSWMDLWGTGWLDDRELWQRLGRLHSIAEAMATRRRNPRTRPIPEPDVAVIVDERSFFDLRCDETVLSHLVAQQRDALLRSGARIGFYLLSDLLKKNFPEGPRLLLFLNAFRISDAHRAVIRDRFQNNGRTLAWVYGPGSRETNLGELTDVIGMQLRLQPFGSKVGTQPLPNARSPLSEALRGQRLGEETRLNPSFYVADPKATPLGEYAANGNTSLAVRKHARWQSVFIGEMELTVPLLRGLYRMAGVPVFTVDDDVATVGECLLSLHSAPGGGTTVYLPEEGVLYDLLSDEVLATDGWGARISMPPRGTRLLFWGSAAEVSRLGGDPRNGPPGLTTAELLPKPHTFVFENSGGNAADGRVSGSDYDSRIADVSPEDDALMQAALAGELPGVPDVDEDGVLIENELPIEPAAPTTLTEESAADAAKKKRRRRRRGRGRGASEGSETDENGTSEGGDDESDDDNTDPFRDSSDTTADGDEFDDSDPFAETPAPLAVVDVPPPAASMRTRPTLEELLPNSDEVAEGVDLPPIPEEFLPLNAAAPAEGETAAPYAGYSPAIDPETGGPRRRRGRGVGRPRAPRVDDANGDVPTSDSDNAE